MSDAEPPGFETIEVGVDGPVGPLWLARPDKLNPLSTQTLGEPGLLATRAHTNAMTESMVGTGRSWADADGLEAGLRDPEGRAVRRQYLDRRG